MNVRLQKQFSFSAGILFNRSYQICDYTVWLDFFTNTEDSYNQNVALGRIETYFYEILQNSVLLSATDTDKISAFTATGMRVVQMPEEAYDQLLGIMLYCKLNAIAEEQLIITDVKITSNLGNGVYYLHNEAESLGPFNDMGWWHESDASYDNGNKTAAPDKVVKITQDHSWNQFKLGFEQDPAEDKKGAATVLKVEFKKDANQ